MPGTDMPLEQMKQYRGTTPLPEDFCEFWKCSMDGIKQKMTKISIERVPFSQENLECYWISIEAVDGCRLYAKYVRPAGGTEVPLVIQFHDYPFSSRSWFYLSRYAAIGYGVLAPDCRGQAGRSENGKNGAGPTAAGPMFNGMVEQPRNMYLYHLMEDALLWIKAVLELPAVDKSRKTVYGEGQGAGLAVVCAAMYPDIQKCVAHYPMLCDYKRVWDMDFDVNAYEGLRYYFRWHDPMHEREEEIFQKLAYMDVINFAPYVGPETLMSTGLQDVVSPPSAQFAVFNRLKCHKRHLVYPKHGHELNNFFENEFLKFLLT